MTRRGMISFLLVGVVGIILSALFGVLCLTEVCTLFSVIMLFLGAGMFLGSMVAYKNHVRYERFQKSLKERVHDIDW